MSRDLPYSTPEEEGLDACSREPFDVIEESRFEDPDAKPADFRKPALRADGTHEPGCPCNDCRCPKCDRRGGRTNCETCARLNAPPFECGPYPKHWDNAPDYNPPKPEIWPTIRYNGQRMGVGMPVLPKCAKCGHGIRENLREVGDGFECRDTASCAAQVRANSKLRLIRGEKP